MCIAVHLIVAISLKRIVGGRIEGILKLHTKLRVLTEMRVGEKNGPLTFRMLCLEQLYVASGNARLPQP